MRDGSIFCNGKDGAHLVARENYGDFEFAGEWNTIHVVIREPNIALWQNGVQLVDADMESEDWKARLARWKFATSEQFNKAASGHIALQNYRGADVWFHNLRIRELPGD